MNIEITGTVIAGNRLGNSLGFPTANIALDTAAGVADGLAAGVYAATVDTPAGTFRAMANIGTRPTVGRSSERLLEVHLFGFRGDLYGLAIHVALHEFIRPETRFCSIAALKQAIENDKTTILDYFDRYGIQS
ncbi:MAG: riboflavin kinase [Rikenellaceae bacterium]|jgi:riboflavin kinase/FMN adenylyltransferase|nr:riboflavin kinase [Rikenellaceae bacterium]